jgi:hypothetical protein
MVQQGKGPLPEPVGDDRPSTMGELVVQGADTISAVNGLRAAVEANTRALRRTWLVGGLVILALIGVAVDNHRQISVLRGQFCPVVRAIVDAPAPQPGRDGARARVVVQRFRVLGVQFDCPVSS